MCSFCFLFVEFAVPMKARNLKINVSSGKMHIFIKYNFSHSMLEEIEN